MAQPVRCDVCGKLFSSSYVGAHKRLAHPKQTSTEPASVKKILTLFDALSAEGKKKVLTALGVSEGKSTRYSP
jgi:DNA-directed RNA polymerase subunit N (RpoN/RPB10)